jgi:hypothetical protein
MDRQTSDFIRLPLFLLRKVGENKGYKIGKVYSIEYTDIPKVMSHRSLLHSRTMSMLT